jgi:nitronate monooxygenase
MAINTRLTEAFKLTHPVILAPMGVAASGRLAAAVAAAGGLGLIGVGYRGQDWIESQTDAAGNVPIGAGFITWRLQMSPELLDVALARRPSAICLSFGDPQPFAKKVHAASPADLSSTESLARAAGGRGRRHDRRCARSRGWRSWRFAQRLDFGARDC